MPHPRIAMSLLALSSIATAGAADGIPDPAFGLDGLAWITPDDVEARQLHPHAAAVLPDGRLLFGGFRSRFIPEVPFEPELRAMLARMNADGSVDATFGNTSIPGVVALPEIAPDARVQSIEALDVLADGRVLAVGGALAPAPVTGFLVRLLADGSVDTAFGDAGFVRMPFTALHALAIDGDGRIVVAGTNLEDFGDTYGTVARFDADGAVDAGFADAGVRVVEWDGANAGTVDALALDADGRILVGGRYERGGLASDAAIARLDADGDFDATFAGSGWRLLVPGDIASSMNTVQRIAATADGGVAFAGQYENPSGRRALALGRLRADGSTDTGFGDPASPGWQRPPIVPDAFVVDATDLLVRPDGSLVVSAAYYSPTVESRFLVVRTTADGLPDPAFGEYGVLQPDAAAGMGSSESASLALQPDGALIVAGAAERSEPLIELAVTRLLDGAGGDRIFADGFEPTD